ncbi:MAG TPA: cupin domain-containing protein [Gammaproteobacteria bacterium]|nr:cupin domain-containing protein [Gammaproteobacteria bacterium]
MRKRTNRILVAPVVALASLIVALSAGAQDGPSPVRMDPEKMAGLDLTPIPNDGFIDILVEGELEFEIASLFDGEELRAVVVESTPAKTDHRNRPLEYDEFVLVLNGKLVLTEQDGTVHEFLPGDAFIVPKGYTGTWEQHGRYRELAVIGAAAQVGGE